MQNDGAWVSHLENEFSRIKRPYFIHFIIDILWLGDSTNHHIIKHHVPVQNIHQNLSQSSPFASTSKSSESWKRLGTLLALRVAILNLLSPFSFFLSSIVGYTWNWKISTNAQILWSFTATNRNLSVTSSSKRSRSSDAVGQGTISYCVFLKQREINGK